ncbi:MAG: methyltransferase domain-containing protein [Kutzneria sp.]|nr:methyltransferase domain-containing protein [Kutzneria sp.]MBV9847786.1 methyltransferase domain-containing protein [Kutzneria sp.]
MSRSTLGDFSSATAVFNAIVVGWAVKAAWELGIFVQLDDQGELDLPSFAHTNDLHMPSLNALVRALEYQGIVTSDGGVVRRGTAYDQFDRTRGLFHWLTGGYGELFRDLAKATRNSERFGDFIRRDSTAVSIACRDVGTTFMNDDLYAMIDDLGHQVVADLGCGSADRLIDIARRDPAVRCVGIDLAKEALAVAQQAIGEAGLVDRIGLVHADVSQLGRRPEFDAVELVTCFLMGHDLWPRDNCVRVLRDLRATFPSVRHLLLGDTCRSVGTSGSALPIFTLGFEVLHDVMGQYVPTEAEWLSVFDEAGWIRERTHTYVIPPSTVVFQLAPKE